MSKKNAKTIETTITTNGEATVETKAEATGETTGESTSAVVSQIIPPARKQNRIYKTDEEKAAVIAARLARVAAAKTVERVHKSLLENEIVTTATFWAGIPVETAMAVSAAIQASAEERVKQAEIRELKAKLEALQASH